MLLMVAIQHVNLFWTLGGGIVAVDGKAEGTSQTADMWPVFG